MVMMVRVGVWLALHMYFQINSQSIDRQFSSAHASAGNLKSISITLLAKVLSVG